MRLFPNFIPYVIFNIFKSVLSINTIFYSVC